MGYGSFFKIVTAADVSASIFNHAVTGIVGITKRTIVAADTRVAWFGAGPVFAAVAALGAAGTLAVRPANRIEITFILGDPVAFADGAGA